MIQRKHVIRPPESFSLINLLAKPSSELNVGAGAGEVVYGVRLIREMFTQFGDQVVILDGHTNHNTWSQVEYVDFLVYAGRAQSNWGGERCVYSWRGAHWVLAECLGSSAVVKCPYSYEREFIRVYVCRVNIIGSVIPGSIGVSYGSNS